jgi:hypothetical protein
MLGTKAFAESLSRSTLLSRQALPRRIPTALHVFYERVNAANGAMAIGRCARSLLNVVDQSPRAERLAT